MAKKLLLIILVILVTVGLLVGCGGTGAEEPAPTDEAPVSQEVEGKVVAEAVIEPVRWSELRFANGGTAVEVLVEERHKGKWRGRTRTNKLVFFDTGQRDWTGYLARVRITRTGPWSMQGEAEAT